MPSCEPRSEVGQGCCVIELLWVRPLEGTPRLCLLFLGSVCSHSLDLVLRDPVMLGADFLMRPVFAGLDLEVLCGGRLGWGEQGAFTVLKMSLWMRDVGRPGLDAQVGRKLCFGDCKNV